MTVWRPSPTIKVKVIGLAWRGEQLLVAEVEDDAGRVKGFRPLGGCVEFGETREAALAREFEEELGCAVEVIGPWHGFENVYEHHGSVGHEFVFAANVWLGDEILYRQEEIRFAENDLVECRAIWIDPTDLPNGTELYPTGLSALVAAGTASPDT